MQLKLNKEIVYDLHVNTGAIHTECNLSEFKIDELSIESGASNINLVIPEYNSKITIDTGVSNIDIAIPNNVGVMLIIDSGIAVKNLDDFIKENNNYTVMGFPVNVAARLESSTKELNNNFIVSEYVYAMLAEQKSVTEQKQINLKGVSEPFVVRLMGKPFAN